MVTEIWMVPYEKWIRQVTKWIILNEKLMLSIRRHKMQQTQMFVLNPF